MRLNRCLIGCRVRLLKEQRYVPAPQRFDFAKCSKIKSTDLPIGYTCSTFKELKLGKAVPSWDVPYIPLPWRRFECIFGPKIDLRRCTGQCFIPRRQVWHHQRLRNNEASLWPGRDSNQDCRLGVHVIAILHFCILLKDSKMDPCREYGQHCEVRAQQAIITSQSIEQKHVSQLGIGNTRALCTVRLFGAV